MPTYLITGSNRGIGLELCRQIHNRGDNVIATCRQASKELRDLGVRIEENIEISSNESIMPHLIDSKFHKPISIPGKKFVNNDSV